MKNDLQITYYNSYYHFELQEKQSFEFFSRLTNWLSAEFDLFLQEQLKNKLLIYCPNGSVVVIYNHNTETLTIGVENKIKKECLRAANIIIKTYSLLQDLSTSLFTPELEAS